MIFKAGTRLLAVAAAALSAVFAAGEAAAQKTQVTVYTAMENDQLGPYKQAFEAENPTVEIVWVRDSTGVVTARFLAEKDNPRADIVWGLAASSMALFEAQGLLEPYTPPAAKDLKPIFKSGKNPETWVGMDAFLAVVCFNTAEAAKAGAPKPATWDDLTNAAYKGKVVMPHPASSGTGYLTIAAWLQLMGEEKGWQFMDKLHDNIAVYTHSGSAPCVQAARGERMIGIGFDMRGASEKTKGAPIDLIVPKEGIGGRWKRPASSRARRTSPGARRSPIGPRPRRRTSSTASTTRSSRIRRSRRRRRTTRPRARPRWSRTTSTGWRPNRERILAEWSKRYESKAAPK